MTHHNVVGRRLDPLTGKIYHLLHRPPTGVDEMEIRQRLVQRADDTRKRIATRLAAYHAHLSGVLVVYQKVRMDLRLGDGGGKTSYILLPYRQLRTQIRRAKASLTSVRGMAPLASRVSIQLSLPFMLT